MRTTQTCDCHPDYHELGVHRPELEPTSPPPAWQGVA